MTVGLKQSHLRVKGQKASLSARGEVEKWRRSCASLRAASESHVELGRPSPSLSPTDSHAAQGRCHAEREGAVRQCMRVLSDAG